MKTTDFNMSYFMPPIAPVRDERGKVIIPASLTPCCNVSVEQLHRMITCDENLKTLTEQVRNAEDLRAAKAKLLPFVTPCGIFTHRNSKSFALPSGLVVVDIDHLSSPQEAQEMSQTLFDDPYLCPVLTFVSPSGRGVKALVPCSRLCTDDEVLNITQNMRLAMQYIEMTYGPEGDLSTQAPSKVVDTSGKDIVRACFLSHDPNALQRML